MSLNTTDEYIWRSVHYQDMWVLDKLILAKSLNYVCGPVGTPVKKPGWYIVRPIVNPNGLGLGTQRVFIESSTDHLPLGHFWCEEFKGDHLSVDLVEGEVDYIVRGFRSSDDFTRWDCWVKVHGIKVNIPPHIQEVLLRYSYTNIEMIGGRIIEVHLRPNADFHNRDINTFIPVWEGEEISPPDGYSYIEYPDIHGRVGAYVK